MEIQKQTILDLLRLNGIKDEITEVKPTTFFGYLYDNTFGAQEATIEDITNLIEDLKPKKVLELMGGNGFESYLLSQKFPDVSFTYLDILEYDSLYLTDNCKFLRGDCLLDSFIDKFDIIFVGTTNASVSEFTEVEELRKLMTFCSNNITETGECFLGMATGVIPESKVELEFSVSLNYKGEEVRWGLLVTRDLEELVETYYCVWLDKTILHYNPKPYRYKIWGLDIVKELSKEFFILKNRGERFVHLKRK